MAGAVGMEVISPMPMAPQATFSPAFSTMMGVISGIWLARNRPRVPYLAVGLAVRQGIALRQGKAQGHHHAAFDLPLDGQGVHGLAHIVGGHHLLDLALFIQNADLGGIAVGDMADGVGHVGAQGVRFAQVFAVEFLAVHLCQGFFL